MTSSGNHEAEHTGLTESENKVFLPYLADLKTYGGLSERIKGFRRIHEAIANISGVVTVDPIIVLTDVYDEYVTKGKSDVFMRSAQSIWDSLDGAHNHLIVRRLFPDETGEAQEGPRSGNVASLETLATEMERFFQYFRAHYDKNKVLPEIMVHRVVDAANPPKLQEPFLPYASGDVTPISSHRFQIRATFGADESVQGFPTDTWEVSYEPGGSVRIMQRSIGRKTQSKIPASGQYRTFDIPEQFHDKPALVPIQVLTLAQAARDMATLYGAHRLEFDGTKQNGQDVFAVIEAAPFEIRKNTPEVLAGFDENIILPVTVLQDEHNIENISSQRAIIYVDPKFFQGNEQRELLNCLSVDAREKNIQLIVLASGNIATQHAVRVLMDNGHVVQFVEEEEFLNNENIRIYPIKNDDGIVRDINWEREDPLVPHERIWGRAKDKIGGKTRGLRELERHGFNVPPYAVIETSLFRRLLEMYDPEGRIASLEDVFEPSAIQAITAPVQRKIRETDGNFLPNLEDTLKALGGSTFSVRSSATCEDDRNTSFAGIFSTYLNIPIELVRNSIKEVLSSALSPEAIRLARVSGIKPKDVKMAVILQRMVEARAAGTVFTIDASARRRDVLRIEATKGLGEGIVDGTAKAPLSLQLDRRTGEVFPMNVVYQKEEILSPQEVQKLRQVALEIEDKFQEGPQDIEWAIDKNGELFLLQARPLTDIK